MSKSKVKSGMPTKPVDTLAKVKNGGVTKPANGVKTKSKEIAKSVARKEEKPKKVVKEPTPSDSEDSDSESDSEVETKPVANVKVDSAKPMVKASGSDSDSDSADDSDDAPAPNGAKLAADSDESSDESESDKEKPVVSVVKGTKTAAKDEDESDDSDSDEEDVPKAADGVAEADSDPDDSDDSESDTEVPVKKDAKTNGVAKVAPVDDDDDDDSDDGDDSEEEDEKEVKPKSSKRKAEAEEEVIVKKPKTEEAKNSNTLFVGSLSWNITDDWLKEEFESMGELVGARVVTDRATGRSKGFGYVEFVNAADAARAHSEKAGAELDGRTMNIDFSNPRPDNKEKQDTRSKTYGDQTSTPNDTLFLGNLPFDIDTEQITEAFQAYGTIMSVRIPTDRETEKPRGFGYVSFASVEEATAALEAMKGQYLGSRPLRLDYSPPRDNNRGGDDSRGRGGFGGRGRGGFDRGGRGGGRGRGGFDRGGRGGSRGRGGSTNRGGFGDFSGKKVTF